MDDWGEQDGAQKTKTHTFIHAAEGTFFVHALPITYASWFSPKFVSESGDLKKLEEGLAINVSKYLDRLELELKGSGGGLLMGDKVTAADTMNIFGIQFIFARDLCAGRKIREWPRVGSG